MICNEAAKSVIDVEMKSLWGRVLTLLDGVIQDDTSRKAAKDMAKGALGDFSRRVKSSFDNLNKEGV